MKVVYEITLLSDDETVCPLHDSLWDDMPAAQERFNTLAALPENKRWFATVGLCTMVMYGAGEDVDFENEIYQHGFAMYA